MKLKRYVLSILVACFLISVFIPVARILGIPTIIVNFGGVLISLAVLAYFLGEEKKEKEKSAEVSSKDSN